MLKDKKCLILGVANNKSIACGITSRFKEHGARPVFSHAGEAIHKHVKPIFEELGGEFIFPCDMASGEDIITAAALVKEEWDGVDVLVHSVAFANREDLIKRLIETSRDGFATALNASAYSLTALCHVFEPMPDPDMSVFIMTYYGAQKIITNYNVMGVAKAALEAPVCYLSVDLGAKDVHVNAISAGPIKMLASPGISDLKQIFNHIEEHAPLRRNVATEDVGKAAVFLASDPGSAAIGEIMFVDRGYNNPGIQRVRPVGARLPRRRRLTAGQGRGERRVTYRRVSLLLSRAPPKALLTAGVPTQSGDGPLTKKGDAPRNTASLSSNAMGVSGYRSRRRNNFHHNCSRPYW